MKNLKYLFFSLLATVAFAACQDDETASPEVDVENCYDVYFPEQDNADDLTLDPAAPTSLEFTVMRNNDKDAITVPVEILASEEGVFTASEVVFAEGQTETTFTVNFPEAALGTTYDCTVRVTDPQYVSLYSDKPAFVSFSVLRAKWVPVDPDRVITYDDGDGEKTYTGYEWFSDDVTTALFDSFDTWPVKVEVREDTIDENYPDGPNGLGGLYRMIGPYSDDANIEIDARNPKQVFIRQQLMGVNHNTYGQFYISSLAYYYMMHPDAGDPDTYYGKIEHGAIVFPKDALLFGMEKYNNGGLYTANNDSAFRLEICAAQVVDYSLVLTAGEPADGEIQIKAKFGTDVAKVKYAFYEGSISVAQLSEYSKALDADAEAKELNAEGVVTAQFETTGVYSMLANIYDKENKLQGTETVSFGYIAADDEKPVVLTCGINITDRYAPQGNTSEDSAEIYIYGKDIVSGSYALVESEKLKAVKDLDGYLSENGKEFTAAQLEAINGDGFAGVIGNLIGGTEYTLVVKAFNGYVSDYRTATATTNGTPHPLKRTYTITDLSEIGGGKSELFKTWNLWAVDYFDKNKNTKRQKFGQATFSENTEDDVDDGEDSVDAINVKGMSFGESETDDTVVWEYYDGVFYSLGNQLIGTATNQGSTLYLMPTYIEVSSGSGTTGNYAMIGGSVADGYMALVSNNKNYNLNGMLFIAYSDAEATNKLGNWAFFYDIMFEDPAVADSKTEAAAVAAHKATTHAFRQLAIDVTTPNNFVELRGRERMRALIDEMHTGKCTARNVAERIVSVEMPALEKVDAKVTFKAGLSKQSFDRTMLKVTEKASRFAE